jgi:hypothetical protein
LIRNSDGSIYGYDFVSDVNSAGDGDGIDPNPNDEGGDASAGSSYHGTFVASLVVSDPQGLSGAVVATTVQAYTLNAPPVADAGVAQTLKVGATATLDGSASADADGDVLMFTWTPVYRPPGSAATLSVNNIDKPTLVPDVAGVYVFTLVVNDGLADSAQATVTMTAMP